MKTYSWDEKYVVLNINSKRSVIHLAGLIAGLGLSILASFILYPLASFVPELGEVYSVAVLSVFFVFTLMGFISAVLVQRQVKTTWQEQSSYDYEGTSYGVHFVGLVCLGITLLYLPQKMGFNVSFYVWLSPVLIALALADFVRHLWRVMHCHLLNLMFRYDLECLIIEKRLKDQLKLKMAETRRYGGPFAVLAMTLDKQNELFRQSGMKHWVDLHRQLVDYLDNNARETDIFGRIGDGTIVIALTNTGYSEAEIVAKRIFGLVKKKPFVMKQKPVHLSVSMGVAVYYHEDKINEVEILESSIGALKRL